VYDANGNVISFDATFEQHSEGATPALLGEVIYNAPLPMSGVLGNDTDPDGDLLHALLVTGPAHGTVTLNPDGTFTYTPSPNFNGIDSFTYKANDGSLDSNVATVTITVNPVNDAPSFSVGPNQRVQAGAGPQTVSGWATGISPGPPDEAGQAVNFVVTTTSPNLFAVQPAIDPSGTLTYTPAANAFGTAIVVVTLHDNGG